MFWYPPGVMDVRAFGSWTSAPTCFGERKKHIKKKTRKQIFHGIVPGFWGGILFMCFSSPIRNDPKKTHKQNFGTHPVPGQSRKFVYVYVFFLSLMLVFPRISRAWPTLLPPDVRRDIRVDVRQLSTPKAYPLAQNQYINNSPGVFSCIRAGANTGAACIRTKWIRLRIWHNTQEK